MKDHVRFPVAFLASLVLLASLALGQGKTAPTPYAKVDIVLKAKCVGCHQGATPSGGVNLTSYENVMKSKFKGKPIVMPKNVNGSVLAQSLHGKGVMKMPPGGALPASDAKIIAVWILAGAKK